MKLTRRGHYGIKALLDLAIWGDKQPVPVRAIAQRQSIPAPYLEKILMDLRRAHLVASVRGAGGGYQLLRSPAAISIYDILTALGEATASVRTELPAWERSGDRVTLSLWQRLEQTLVHSLRQVSLEDLYHDARSWQATQEQDAFFVV